MGVRRNHTPCRGCDASLTAASMSASLTSLTSNPWDVEGCDQGGCCMVWLRKGQGIWFHAGWKVRAGVEKWGRHLAHCTAHMRTVSCLGGVAGH